MDKSKKRKAFFFTLFYPFTHQGVSYDFYIKSEVEKLAGSFDTVDIISLSSEHDGRVEIPGNVNVHNLNIELTFKDKCSLLKLVGRNFFRKELSNLNAIYNRRFDLSLIKAISAYAVKANKYSVFLESLLNKINFKEYEVCLYCYWNFEYALAAILLKNKYPIKTVVRSHSFDLYFDRMPEKYQPFRRFVYLNNDLPVFISVQGMNYFFETHKIAASQRAKVIINHIGINNSSASYEMPRQKLILLSNAWIQPLKRIDLLIQSLALINDISIDWIHVGDDYGTNRFPQIKELAKELLGSKKNIYYEFVGRKSIDEVFAIYKEKRVNLFINLSSTEGIPVSMMEALSFGVPVIGTRVGGVPEIIEDGINGFLLPSDITPQDVAAKIKLYFDLPEESKKGLEKNARRIWNEKFNAERNSAGLIERILSL